MTTLQIENLTTGYGELEIVHRVDLDVPAQSIVTIVGPNGAGKSTLIKSVTGFIDIWEGDVFLDEERLTDRRPDERADSGIAYVPQADNVFPSLSVRENLEIGSYLKRDQFSESLAEVHDLFPILEERMDQNAGTLSGGQRQMLALARALMSDPDLLVLDEPTAGVQPNLVDDILEMVVDIKESQQISVLMIEQNARRALNRSDLGYVMANGEVAHEGDATELLNDEEVVDTFLGG